MPSNPTPDKATCEVRLSLADAKRLKEAAELTHFGYMSLAALDRIRVAVERAIKAAKEAQ